MRVCHRWHARAQQLQVGGAFLRRQRQVALGQQAGDVVLGVEDALALHLGRVGRQHRRDQRVLEEGATVARGTPARSLQREATLPSARAAGQQVGAAAADVVLVFRDVGQVREIGKRAHHGIVCCGSVL
jgi:hypothetical protein